MKLADLAFEHPYYASDSNWYDRNAGGAFANWEEFFSEYGDLDSDDIDLNLVYRWDVKKYEESEPYCMQLIMIEQRRGIYKPIQIECIEEKDVEAIQQWLKPHFEYLLKLWQPLTNIFLSENNG